MRKVRIFYSGLVMILPLDLFHFLSSKIESSESDLQEFQECVEALNKEVSRLKVFPFQHKPSRKLCLIISTFFRAM